MKSAGFTLPSGPRDIAGGDKSNHWRWLFFRAPDGKTYLIQQDGLRLAE